MVPISIAVWALLFAPIGSRCEMYPSGIGLGIGILYTLGYWTSMGRLAKNIFDDRQG